MAAELPIVSQTAVTKLCRQVGAGGGHPLALVATLERFLAQASRSLPFLATSPPASARPVQFLPPCPGIVARVPRLVDP